MRAIQTGILICLVAITGLLVAIYRQQASVAPTAEPVAEQAEKTAALEPADLAAVEAPQPPQSQAVAPDRRDPKPAASRAYAAPAPQSKPKPKPQAIAEPAPAKRPGKTAAAPSPELTIVGGAADPAEERPEPTPSKPVLQTEETELAVREAEFAEPAPAPREPRVVTIPAGERLSVRIDNTLSSARNRADDTFFATLDEQLIVDGLIVADTGARLQGRIVEARQAGRLKGVAHLAFELTHLDTDDGQRVEIRTSVFSMDGRRTRGKDLKKVAMGAGAGAILGAIFGGGKGAAIGAASGAGAGAGTAAATRGEPAVIEPETRLEFRLTNGVTITERL